MVQEIVFGLIVCAVVVVLAAFLFLRRSKFLSDRVIVQELKEPGVIFAKNEVLWASCEYVELLPQRMIPEYKTGSCEEILVILEGEGIVYYAGKPLSVFAPAAVHIGNETHYAVRNGSSHGLLKYCRIMTHV